MGTSGEISPSSPKSNKWKRAGWAKRKQEKLLAWASFATKKTQEKTNKNDRSSQTAVKLVGKTSNRTLLVRVTMIKERLNLFNMKTMEIERKRRYKDNEHENVYTSCVYLNKFSFLAWIQSSSIEQKTHHSHPTRIYFVMIQSIHLQRQKTIAIHTDTVKQVIQLMMMMMLCDLAEHMNQCM